MINKTNLSIDNFDNSAFLEDIPFDKVYEFARKEASRKKPAFFVHKYFARRITLNFRMMLLGALLSKEDSIFDEIYKSHNCKNLENITILDPFMGGGTTLFEAIRFGTKVIGCDLQPLSKFVTKALIQDINIDNLRNELKKLENSVSEKLKKYYETECPNCHKTADVMYYFHVKKVKTNTNCKEHFLYSSFVISFKNNIFTLICPKCGNLFEHNFKENGEAICPNCKNKIFDPKEGYVKKGKFTCNNCEEEKNLIDYTFEDGYPFSTQIVALEYFCPNCKSHSYKKSEYEDIKLYETSCFEYNQIKDRLPIPQQTIPTGYNTNQIINHGYKKFSDLFNKRQLLCLGTLLKSINEIEDKDSQFWLQVAFSGMLEMNNMFCRYQANAYKICNIFFNHAYVPITMPVENNIWGTTLGTGTFIKTIEKIIRSKEFCTNIYDIFTDKKYSDEIVKTKPTENIIELAVNRPVLHCGDSKNLSFINDKSIDIILTDPPFGSNIMYSELIDFFHVWNYYSSIGKNLGFTEPLSPKENEIIVNSKTQKTQDNYSNDLFIVFKECNRILKDKGYLIFSFHDKKIESWFSIFESIFKSNFQIKKAYPLHSESRTGAHTSNKNSIALDIMIICTKKDSSFYESYNLQKEESINNYVVSKTEKILNRLFSVNAEITELDIKNILISQYLTACNIEKLNLEDTVNYASSNLTNNMFKICKLFSENITNKRTGWWSELFRNYWNIYIIWYY